MPRNPIILLGNTYKTQGEFKAYVKNLIYNDIGICNDIKNIYPSHYITLFEILKRHQEFDSKTRNMSNIKIITNKLNKNALETIIINTDGSEIDISWIRAITGNPKKNDSDLMEAFRSSIVEQLIQFKNDNEDLCVFCHNTYKLHVDHITHFEELVLNFISIMKQQNINIPNTFADINDGSNRKCFLEIDDNFKNEWVDYHSKNASLRILCQNCNLTRPKYKK